jgi:hypothetical protein
MGREDDELALFRTSVSCAALLERLPPAWQLDRKQSTRRALKYRRGTGEVLIVNHDEKGWWDPHSTAKGDVFDLVKHLEPDRNFGQVLQVLRRFVGLPPSYPTFPQEKRRTAADVAIQARWSASRCLRRGSPAWIYLTEARGLPPSVVLAAIGADVVREGHRGSAWFAHRDGATVAHVEVRGPDYRGSLRGGTKTLFRLRGNGNGPTHRVAVTEAPIDALSLAAIEDLRADTLYVATGGGMGPGTLLAIERALADMAAMQDAVLVGATDADAAGERYAARHAEMASAAGIAFARLRPTVGEDWNDMIRRRNGH